MSKSKKMQLENEVEIPYSKTKEARALYRKRFYENNKSKVLAGQKDYKTRKALGLPLKINEDKKKKEVQKEKWREEKRVRDKAAREKKAKEVLDNYNAKYGNPHETTDNET